MNAYKLQIDLLKERSKHPEGIRAHYEVTTNGVLVVDSKGMSAYRVSEYSWHLSHNVFCSNDPLPKAIKELLELTTEDFPLDFKGRTIEYNKKKYAIFYSRYFGKEVYADIALMKYFSPQASYYKADKPGFIKVIENNEVVGCFGEYLDRNGVLK